jgi:hypothetical protein
MLTMFSNRATMAGCFWSGSKLQHRRLDHRDECIMHDEAIGTTKD